MKTLIGFGDLALIFKVTAELSRSNLSKWLGVNCFLSNDTISLLLLLCNGFFLLFIYHNFSCIGYSVHIIDK